MSAIVNHITKGRLAAMLAALLACAALAGMTAGSASAQDAPTKQEMKDACKSAGGTFFDDPEPSDESESGEYGCQRKDGSGCSVDGDQSGGQCWNRDGEITIEVTYDRRVTRKSDLQLVTTLLGAGLTR
jgi:hypothetical protein